MKPVFAPDRKRRLPQKRPSRKSVFVVFEGLLALPQRMNVILMVRRSGSQCLKEIALLTGGFLHPALSITIVLLGVLTAFPALSQGANGRSADQFEGRKIDELVVRFGLPSQTGKSKDGRIFYVWRLKSFTGISINRARGRKRVLTCEVRVSTSLQGNITAVKTKVSDVAAGVYAAAGAFGSLCSHRFGV